MEEVRGRSVEDFVCSLKDGESLEVVHSCDMTKGGTTSCIFLFSQDKKSFCLVREIKVEVLDDKE